MKKVALFLVFLVSLFSMSCETELASSVDQDRIYTIYETFYDRNRDLTTVRAIFKFGNALGTQLQLDGQAEVRFNNDVLNFNSVLGLYERQYAGFVNGGTFAYRDANGRTLTNSISGLKTVEFPGNFPTTLGRSNSFTLAWAGEPLGQNERLDAVVHGPSVTDAQTFIQPAAGSTSIILRADMLGRLGVGQGNAALFRYLVLPLQQATSAGGSISGRHQPTNRAVSIQ
jgi:hypothetical protein